MTGEIFQSWGINQRGSGELHRCVSSPFKDSPQLGDVALPVPESLAIEKFSYSQHPY